MARIIPITELGNAAEIFDLCHESKEPVFVTKNGCGDVVIMSREAFDAISKMDALDKKIMEAEATYQEDGKLEDARQVVEELRRRYFGKI